MVLIANFSFRQIMEKSLTPRPRHYNGTLLTANRVDIGKTWKGEWHSMKQSYDVYYGTNLAITVDPLIRWHQLRDIKKNKLRAPSDACCLGVIGQSIYEISHFASLRHCLRLSKWRVRRPVGRNLQPYDKLRYSSEPPCHTLSEICAHWIVAQPTKGPQPDLTSIQSKLTATYFRSCQSWKNWVPLNFYLINTMWLKILRLNFIINGC